MSRRSVYGSLLGLVFMVNLARVVFAPLLDPLDAAFGGVSEATLGLVATLAWLGSALPRIPTGYLLTRSSREMVVLASGLVFTAAATAMTFAATIEAVMVGAFLMGLSSGSYFIAANPLISELFPDRVGSALGTHGTASQLAAVSATPIVVAALALGDWRTAIRAMAVAGAVVTVAFVLAARWTPMPDAGGGDRDMLGAVRRQWPIVLAAVAVVGLTGLVWNGLFNFYVKFLLSEGLASGRANLMLTLVFGAGVPAFFVTGRLADHVPVVPLLLSVVGLFALCVVALTFAQGLLAFAALSLLTGYAIHSVFPAVDTFLLGSLPDQHRASAYAVYSGSMMIVQATGSTVVGTLASSGFAYDTIFTWLGLGLVVVLAGLLALYASGRLPTDARVVSGAPSGQD